MRIAFFVRRFPAISETFILRQVTGLVDRGHDVDIYPDRATGEALAHDSVTSYRLLQRTYGRPEPRRGAARAAVRLAQFTRMLGRAPGVALRSLDVARFGRAALAGEVLDEAVPLVARGCPSYDVIHAHFAPAGLRAVRMRRIGAVAGPVVTTFHGIDVNVGAAGSLARRYGLLWREGDLYTANTDFTAGRAAALGCPRGRIRKLPVGVKPGALPFRERHREAGQPVRMLTVARLVEKKGIEYAVRAVARLGEAHPDLHYDIVGDGPLRGELQSLITELGMAERIRLLGAMTESAVAGLYGRAHLFVLPSVTAANGDMEGQGLVLQEAQAAGIPVVSTHHNGIPEGVVDGVTGFLVPERDVDALAGCLAGLLAKPETWPALGRAGRALVEAEFDIDRLNDRLLAVYAEARAAARGS